MTNLFKNMIEFSKKNQGASIRDIVKVTIVAHFKESAINKLQNMTVLKSFGMFNDHINSHITNVGTNLIDSVSHDHVDGIFEGIKKIIPDSFLEKHPKIKNIILVIDANFASIFHQIYSDNPNSESNSATNDTTTNNTTNDATIINL